MNTKVNTESVSSAQVGVGPSSNIPDQDTQAVSDLGELAFLANAYETQVAKYGAGSTQALNALKDFQKVYALFHINGNVITFDYNEGAQTLSITDPDAIEILQHLPKLSNPPTAADVGTYINTFWNTTNTIHWADGTDQTIQQRIMEFFVDTKFTMENNTSNTITNTSIVLFYCSLVNVPGSQMGGSLDKFFLSLGYKDGAMIDLGNIWAVTAALCAHLHNDSFLDPDVIAAGMNVTTTDPLYQLLGQFFSSNYQDYIKNPENEDAAWQWEARFLPYWQIQEEQRFAVPGSNETELEKRMDAERKSKQDIDELMNGNKNKRKLNETV